MNNKFNIVFLDVLFCFLLLFLCIVLLLKTKEEHESYFRPEVLYQFILEWDGPSDQDAWVMDSRNNICGYRRREGGSGSLMSLNHDSLGNLISNLDEFGEIISESNQEIINFRGVFSGEYIFNYHVYNLRKDKDVKVTARFIQLKPFKEIIKTTKIAKNNGDEVTFFRVSFNTDGEVIGTSDLPAKFIYNNP